MRDDLPMEILKRESVRFVTMNRGEETRRYYEQAEHGFRIVDTVMPPGHVQNEHRHDHLLDITFVLEGEVRVSQREGGELHEETLRAGDMVCFAPPHFHNVANLGDVPARTLTLKLRHDAAIDPREVALVFDRDWIGYAQEPERPR